MGVFYVQEENPFNSFLKGVAPIADAWGDRYKERHKVNIRNRAEELAKAQAPLKTREDFLAESGVKEAKPEYFSDEGYMDWGQGQRKFGINSSVDDFVNAYSSSGFGNIAQASEKAAQRVMNYQSADERMKQVNSKIQADFDQQQALKRAKIEKDGVGVFEYQGMQDLFNREEQKQRLSQINPGNDHMQLINALIQEAANKGDLATMAALTGYKVR